MGDRLAALAVDNGWEGVVLHGASQKRRAGERDVPVAFGGAVFTPGATVVSDEDGLVVLPASPPR